MSNIGAKVVNRRQELNITQEELAEACGVSQSTIFKLESGKIQEPRFIAKLALALDTTVEELLDEQKDDLGQRVKIQRLKLGFNQSELANKLGTTGQTIANIESGASKKSRILNKLLDFLDLKSSPSIDAIQFEKSDSDIKELFEKLQHTMPLALKEAISSTAAYNQAMKGELDFSLLKDKEVQSVFCSFLLYAAYVELTDDYDSMKHLLPQSVKSNG